MLRNAWGFNLGKSSTSWLPLIKTSERHERHELERCGGAQLKCLEK